MDKINPMSLKPNMKYIINNIYLGDVKFLNPIPDESVDLIVTSPPYYNANKSYQIGQTFIEYLELIKNLIDSSIRVLKDGGRICINVANSGRNPYVPIVHEIYTLMEKSPFVPRGEIIWNKVASVGGSTAWGSWRSASNPCLRDVHEYILIFSKKDSKRDGKGRINTISAEMFTSCTKSIWDINTISAKKRGHEAPFPIEIPQRLIELYSFKNDIVLDPFMGSGTTAEAAILSGRKWIGFDKDINSVNLTKKYVKELTDKLGETKNR